MNKTDYDGKIQDLLKDEKTYYKMSRNPTNKYKDQLKKKLKHLTDTGMITVQKYHQLYPSSDLIPRLYGLPKICKPPCPLRPTVSSIGPIIHEMARFVADIILIGPLIGKSSHHIKNSTDFVDKLKTIHLEEQDIMVSYDVTGLFTSVPIPKAVEVVKSKLEMDPTLQDCTCLSVDQTVDLLAFCMNTTYLTYNNNIYGQQQGAAYGISSFPHHSKLVYGVV